jgi:nucleoside-diphosphate-sugar epimerase
VFDGRERADNPAMLAWQHRQPHRKEVGMKAAVVAGDGLIAPMVASKFNEHGHRAVIASPLTSSSTLTVDELAQMFTGAQIVVDVTDSPPYEDRTAWDFLYNRTGNLLAAATVTGVSHIVTLSVIGTNRLPASSYFRAKARQEQLITEAGIPFSIVRATPCYESLRHIADLATDGDTIRISSALTQPIASQDVATALALTAFGEPVAGIREVAGPHQYSLDDLVRAYLRAHNDTRRVLTDPQARYLGAKLNERSLLPSRIATVFPTQFADWLACNMSTLAGRRFGARQLTAQP